jgi:putative DNA primase/helicase
MGEIAQTDNLGPDFSWGAVEHVVKPEKTDLGNAQVFLALYGDLVRFDHSRKTWLVWEGEALLNYKTGRFVAPKGHRWVPQASGNVMRFAMSTVRARGKAAVDLGPAAAGLGKWAKQSESAPRLRAMLELASNLRPIADDGQGWDENQFLLGVPNGVVELDTGTLRPGKTDDKITKQAAVAYDPAATAPRWEQFVSEVFSADAVEYVRRAVGYSFTGDTSEDVLFWPIGLGENGKTTFEEELMKLAGDYGHTMPASTLLDERRGAHTTELADLHGKRFVAVGEVPVSRLNEARIKHLTGGGHITARHMRKDNVTFPATHKLWLDANDYPRVSDETHGFWRRIAMLDCPNVFLAHGMPVPENIEAAQARRRDPQLEAALADEAAGILAWVVRAAKDWWLASALGTTGLGEKPASTLKKVEEFKEDADALGEFREGCLVREPGAFAPNTQIQVAYEHWAEGAAIPKHERLSTVELSRRLAKKFKRGKHGGMRGFHDIRVVSVALWEATLARDLSETDA